MIEVDDKLVSLDVFEKKFACDLASCKGACCIKGDSGAPLTSDEIQRINDSIDQIKPNMRPEGLKAIKEKGIYYIDEDNEPVTTGMLSWMPSEVFAIISPRKKLPLKFDN